MTTIVEGQLVTAPQINQWCPPGVILDYAGDTAPDGWLICDGTAISRTTYADLFAAIGTTWGSGDGSTTFNVPDLRGRVTVGYAPTGGHTDVSTLGANDGVAAANRRPKHRHTAHSHTQLIGTSGAGAVTVPTGVNNATSAPANGAGQTDTSDGGSGNSNDSLDAPAYAVLTKIIRAKDA